MNLDFGKQSIQQGFIALIIIITLTRSAMMIFYQSGVEKLQAGPRSFAHPSSLPNQRAFTATACAQPSRVISCCPRARAG